MHYEKKLVFDISENNSDVNADVIKAMADAGAYGLMVRSSYGKTAGQQDSKFIEFASAGIDAGLKVGAYHFSYSLVPEDALEEAKLCRQVIDDSGLLLELPVFFDMESDDWKTRHNMDESPENITAICQNFLANIGLNCGIYSFLSYLNNKIDWKPMNVPIWNSEILTDNQLAALLDGTRPVQDGDDSINGYMWQFAYTYPVGGVTCDASYLYLPVED